MEGKNTGGWGDFSREVKETGRWRWKS